MLEKLVPLTGAWKTVFGVQNWNALVSKLASVRKVSHYNTLLRISKQIRREREIRAFRLMCFAELENSFFYEKI